MTDMPVNTFHSMFMGSLVPFSGT